MNRRSFLATTGSIGVLMLGNLRLARAAASTGPRLYLELQKYTFEKEEQRQGFETFMKEAAIPAMNRLGLKPIGVFHDSKEPGPAWVLIPHPDAESAVSLTARLLADAEFTAKAGAFIEGPKAAAPYKEMETCLLRAFKGMPGIEIPAKGPDRVFELRIYESPSVVTGQKKIEMFNDAGEIRIFREVGLAPVFFGETLFGTKAPNLTYMLGFENAEAMKAAWGRFGKHPDWIKLRAMPEYADSRVIRAITNIVLKPAASSQI